MSNQDLILETINHTERNPADMDVIDAGSWMERENGNILMAIDRHSLRRHVFLNGGRKKSEKTDNITIYAFHGKFYAIVKEWKRDGIYILVEVRPVGYKHVAAMFAAQTLLLRDDSIQDEARRNLLNHIVERLESRGNTLISIGYMGARRCYLNMSKESAIRRYCETERLSIEEFEMNHIYIHEFKFDDEFCAYEVYSADHAAEQKKIQRNGQEDLYPWLR